MNKKISKPKFIKCGDCGYKERKNIELAPTPNIEGLDAVFFSMCSRCRSRTISLLGNLDNPDAIAFVEELVDSKTILGESPYKT